MRDQIRARIQPFLEEAGEELTSLVMTRIDALVDQVKDAIDVALSSAASDLEPKEDAASTLTMTLFQVGKEPKKLTGLKQFVPTTKPAKITTKGKARERAVMRCKKCGELGKRSDSCGKTHNVSTPPAKEDDDDEEAATPPPPRQTRRRAQTPAASSSTQAPPPLHAPSSPRLASIASLSSRRGPRSVETAKKVVPRADELPGWSPETDRTEEWTALSELTLNRKWK